MRIAQNDVSLPGLDTIAISRFAARWSDEGLWEDIALLADAFWVADGDEERRHRWHHLVLAVGNFKREGGRRIRPGRLTNSTVPAAAAATPQAHFSVPGTAVVLDSEDYGSWVRFTGSLPGAATATATTLLAALWPTRHLVFDWRVHAVADALRLHAGLPTTVELDPLSTIGLVETLDAYAIARVWLLSTSVVTGQALVSVERAMYELSRAADIPRGNAPRTWGAYAEAVEALARNA